MFKNVLEMIGNTEMVQINNFNVKESINIFAKMKI